MILSGKKITSANRTASIRCRGDFVIKYVIAFSRYMHTLPHDSHSAQYYSCYFTSEIAFLISSDVRRSLANL